MRRLALVAVAVSSLALVGWAIAAYQGSRAGLLARKGTIRAAELAPAGEDDVSTRWELTLERSRGERVQAFVRVPKRAVRPYVGIVLVGGAQRGRRVATVAGLDGLASRALIISPDYPMKIGRRSWGGFEAVLTVLGLRHAAFETVGEILALLDYLELRGDVARDHMFLVGSSLGAPSVTIAGEVDDRAAAVIALYGGGRVGRLIAYGLEHSEEAPHPHWRALAFGHGIACLVAPLFPERYAPAIAPRPFLMVNSPADELVPRESIRALFRAARQPKELIWVKSPHIQPTEGVLIGHLAETVTEWLAARRLLPPP